jgi:hypothetical protein
MVLRFSALDETEVLDIADHETVIPCMALDAVHVTLLDVAEVSHAEGEAGDGEVNGQQMTHGWRIPGIGCADIVVIAGLR